jgi:hypothetical protein
MKLKILDKVDDLTAAIRAVTITVGAEVKSVKDVWFQQDRNLFVPETYKDIKRGEFIAILEVVSMTPEYQDVQDHGLLWQWYDIEITIGRKGSEGSSRDRVEIVSDFLEDFEAQAVGFRFQCLVNGEVMFRVVTPEDEKVLDMVFVVIPFRLRIEALRNE